ncbi:CIA30 family protein [uncultured Algibacter sp.]|uniref:CIA30 family protein n=1 Tax=uncultured Algibacter sp. TaxID=298659 RepID=UPI00345D067A
MNLVKFSLKSNISDWRIVDDIVMGGKSHSSFNLSNEGYGVFYGNVSLENNGGFSMIQYKFEPKYVSDYTKICLRLKGDGKTYQFRVKSDTNDKHSYVIPFETSGEWQIIKIPFNSLHPALEAKH